MSRWVNVSLLNSFNQVGGRQIDDFDLLGQSMSVTVSTLRLLVCGATFEYRASACQVIDMSQAVFGLVLISAK